MMVYPAAQKLQQFLPQFSFSLPVFEILLLEEKAESAFVIRRNLNQIGRVFWGRNVEEGVHLSQSTQFDIALIDLNVADTLSLKAFDEFRAAMPDVPVMVLVKDEALLLAESALDEGAVGVLTLSQISQCDYMIKKVTAAVVRAKFLKKARDFKPRTVRRVKTDSHQDQE